MTTKDIVTAVLDAYARGDLEATLDICADDIFYTTQATGQYHTWGFNCRGKAEMRDALVLINTEFQIHTYTVVEVIAEGNRAASRQDVTATSNTTGDMLATQISHWWTVENGKVTSLQEFSDTALIAANRPEAVG